MFDYAGNTGSYPAQIGILDDSDTPNFANFFVGLGGLADRTEFIGFRFVNGYDGGNYFPLSPISIAGDGMLLPSGTQWEVRGTLYLDGTGSDTPTVTVDGPNASVLLQGGGIVDVQSGSAVVVHSGALVEFFSGGGATIAGTFDWLSGSTETFEAGAHLHMIAGAQHQLDRGDAIRIADATDPIFTTPRSRDIAQPLVIVRNPGGGAYTSIGPFTVVDNPSGSSIDIGLTKIINGAKLHAIKLLATWASPHGAPSTPASLTLSKANVQTNTGSVVQTWLLNVGASSGGLATYTLTVDETIDDSATVYYLTYQQEGGISLQAITWWAPTLVFTTIASMRQP